MFLLERGGGLMESASLRRQAMTFPTLLFKLAHGIFMKLFRKGQAWWVMALLGDSRCGISLLRWRAGWRAVAGPGVGTHMLTDTHIKLKKRPVPCMYKHTHTHTDGGRSGQAPDWQSHEVLIFVCSIREPSAKVRTKGHVQHHRQLHCTLWAQYTNAIHLMWIIWIDLLFWCIYWFFFNIVSLQGQY